MGKGIWVGKLGGICRNLSEFAKSRVGTCHNLQEFAKILINFGVFVRRACEGGKWPRCVGICRREI